MNYLGLVLPFREVLLSLAPLIKNKIVDLHTPSTFCSLFKICSSGCTQFHIICYNNNAYIYENILCSNRVLGREGEHNYLTRLGSFFLVLNFFLLFYQM